MNELGLTCFVIRCAFVSWTLFFYQLYVFNISNIERSIYNSVYIIRVLGLHWADTATAYSIKVIKGQLPDPKTLEPSSKMAEVLEKLFGRSTRVLVKDGKFNQVDGDCYHYDHRRHTTNNNCYNTIGNTLHNVGNICPQTICMFLNCLFSYLLN